MDGAEATASGPSREELLSPSVLHELADVAAQVAKERRAEDDAGEARELVVLRRTHFRRAEGECPVERPVDVVHADRVVGHAQVADVDGRVAGAPREEL